MSLPWVLDYKLPRFYQPELGKGVALTEGSDAVIIAYGPVMLSAGVQSAKTLEAEQGLTVKVINLPWLNNVDAEWLIKEVGACEKIFSIDNHYIIGGQGDRLANVLASKIGQGKRLYRIGLEGVPVCGTNSEILSRHGLDSESISGIIRAALEWVNYESNYSSRWYGNTYLRGNSSQA
jgi:transketolase